MPTITITTTSSISVTPRCFFMYPLWTGTAAEGYPSESRPQGLSDLRATLGDERSCARLCPVKSVTCVAAARAGREHRQVPTFGMSFGFAPSTL
jgi:hypothetical protein